MVANDTGSAAASQGAGGPVDLDVAFDPMPGAVLHDRLRALRDEHGSVAPITFYGMPAFAILGYDELRGFFAAQEEFPAVRSTATRSRARWGAPSSAWTAPTMTPTGSWSPRPSAPEPPLASSTGS